MNRVLYLTIALAFFLFAGCTDESVPSQEAADATNTDTIDEAAPAQTDAEVSSPGQVPEWYLGDETTWPAHQPMIGKPAPLLELSDWIGPQQTSEEISGKIVVIDFWATWCGPCLASIPHNNEMYHKFKDDGVVLIGVCGSGSGQELMAETARENGVEYPIAKDATLKSAEAWNVQFWPTYAVIDRKGMVVAVGANHDFIEGIVQNLLDAK